MQYPNLLWESKDFPERRFQFNKEDEPNPTFFEFILYKVLKSNMLKHQFKTGYLGIPQKWHVWFR